MCGFAGFFGYGHLQVNDVPTTSQHMGNAIMHRGPDDSGFWSDNSSQIALVHRRLSILDLSSAGHQPMVSNCGRYVLVYNGEIYNHDELRIALDKERASCSWVGHSDTETLLEAVSYWGIEGTLTRLNGMFAFALWDKLERKLILARDRMGEKPLYYGRCGSSFLFGSELKALKAHPAWCAEIDRNSLALYLRHSFIPAPWSIYSGIHKLPPAHYLVIEGTGNNIGAPRCYWNLGLVALNGQQQPWDEDEEPVNALDQYLRDAVKRRMISDVPLGAFLSGGFDSSTVVALMQAQSNQAIRTFSIGFDEKSFNEAHHAKSVADYLGTQHTEMYVTSAQALSVIPNLPLIYDEPFADSSQIPTYLVSKLARSGVTVSLSGDGGDELFYGYKRYEFASRVWSLLKLLPPSFGDPLSQTLCRISSNSSVLSLAQKLFPEGFGVTKLADRITKFADLLGYTDRNSLYQSLLSDNKEPNKLVLGASEHTTLLSANIQSPKLPGLREQMMYIDQMMYLPDCILAKVDRASMAVGLEARVPLLDHNLVEFAWRLPTRYKYKGGNGKWLLRQVLYRYVPEKLMNRPKMGFGVPIEQWLRGPLRPWAEDLLDESLLRKQGYLNPKPISQMWNEHLTGKRRWHRQLWCILMFQAWLKVNA